MAPTQRGKARRVRTGTALAASRAPTLDDLRRRRDEILLVAASHGAHNVRVFGSVADGRTRPDSDKEVCSDERVPVSASNMEDTACRNRHYQHG